MGKKYSLKTVALAVKIKSLKKLAKVKQPKVARVELRAGGGLRSRVGVPMAWKSSPET